jgi:hypothetical protein
MPVLGRVNHKSSLQGIRSKGPLSGKCRYRKMPFPDSKSTTWEFFTDDKFEQTRLEQRSESRR